MESSATISAPKRSASSSASAVLPHAVGPVRIRAWSKGAMTFMVMPRPSPEYSSQPGAARLPHRQVNHQTRHDEHDQRRPPADAENQSPIPEGFATVESRE